MKRHLHAITLFSGLLALGSAAFAHGDEEHANLPSSASAATAGGHHHEPGHALGGTDAIGAPGQASQVDRSLKVDMTDAMRFSPSSIEVKQGETLRIVAKNSGSVKHEFVLGTEKELREHYELMKKFPEMEHGDPNMVTVAPGKTGEVIWRFTKAGRVDFACLQPGHYDAGMRGAVNVAAMKVGTASVGDGHAAHQH